MLTRALEGVKQQANALPLPFIFRYRSLPQPVPWRIICTDPTTGGWTNAPTSWDGKVEDDGAEDPDETDDGSGPQTGIIADSGTEDDEEESRNEKQSAHLSRLTDPPASAVRKELERRQVQALHCDLSDFPNQIRLRAQMGPSGWQGMLPF